MFKEITEQIKQLTEQTLVPAPEQFTDPVAKKNKLGTNPGRGS